MANAPRPPAGSPPPYLPFSPQTPPPMKKRRSVVDLIKLVLMAIGGLVVACAGFGAILKATGYVSPTNATQTAMVARPPAGIAGLSGSLGGKSVEAAAPASPVPSEAPSALPATAVPPTATTASRPTRTPAPTATTRPPTEIPPSVTPTPNHTLAVGTSVNVRSGPNAAFDKVRTLDAAELVTFEAKKTFQQVLWYKIRTSQGESGWISSEVAALDEALVASLPVSTDSFTLPTAVPEPTAPPPAAAQPRVRYDPFGPDRDCGDFDTYAEAYAFFIAAGGPSRDPHRLDGDHDGIPCESLP